MEYTAVKQCRCESWEGSSAKGPESCLKCYFIWALPRTREKCCHEGMGHRRKGRIPGTGNLNGEVRAKIRGGRVGG